MSLLSIVASYDLRHTLWSFGNGLHSEEALQRQQRVEVHGVVFDKKLYSCRRRQRAAPLRVPSERFFRPLETWELCRTSKTEQETH
eukprot:Skav230779  [mRNA]  locus=scaffold1473:170925:172111:- [translate_table: standard]